MTPRDSGPELRKTKSMTTETHPLAALGPAPYRFVGLETSDDRTAANVARESAGLAFTTNDCGGACDLCGTAIWNVFSFEAANGRRFKLGCDCADLAGLTGQALADFKESRREHARALRAERTRIAREEREAGRKEAAAHAEREAKRIADAIWARTDWREKIDAVVESGSDWAQGVAKSFAERIDGGRELTAGQIGLLDRIHAESIAVDAGHFGEVGGKMTNAVGTVTMAMVTEDAYGQKMMYGVTLETGHSVICFHSGRPWADPEHGDRGNDQIVAGDTVELRFKVKSHGEYQGRSQTVIQRAKCVKMVKRSEAIEREFSVSSRLGAY